MTSSNGNDHFPPIPTDTNESVWVQIKFPSFLIERIDELASADFSNRSAAVCKCVAFYAKSHSQQNTSLPCDGVSVREGEESPVMENNVRSTTSSKEHITSVKARDGVGEESEKPPRKGAWKKEFPECLAEFEQQIIDFWKEKKGSKSERAWTLLMKELSAIHAYLNVGRVPANHERFLEQLELATANRWQGITLKNFKQFAEGNGKAPAPELKHPAAQSDEESERIRRIRDAMEANEGVKFGQTATPDSVFSSMEF